MRALDRLISFIFSVIMLILSIILILVGIGVVEPQMLIDMLNNHVFTDNVINSNTFNAITITGIVLLLASLKTTIFLSLFKSNDKSPILVKTQNGEVEIAQETITNIVKSVGLSFDNIKEVQAKMIKKKKGVVIYSMLLVYVNSNIREITEEMQKQVKEVVKATTGVNVLEVNIKVKNIYSKQKKNDNLDKKQENKENEETAKVEEIAEETNNVENIEANVENTISEVEESVAELDQIEIGTVLTEEQENK
ncbi:MAG: alkaline shock response membrane anchor protein AmaP [Clostridia bacterium]|nr:alkaline shock response membrane anchor protein AmaP [Clostridia bacterium]